MTDDIRRGNLQERLRAMLNRTPKNLDSIQQVHDFKAWHVKAIKQAESSRTSVNALESLFNDAARRYA